MIKCFWGPPANPGQLRFHTATLLSKPADSGRKGRKHFVTHEVRCLYGLQVGKSFFGRIALGNWGMENGPYEPAASPLSQGGQADG